MGKLVQLRVPPWNVNSDCHPKPIFKLRWRIEPTIGIEVYGDWTPKVQFPSLALALSEFADRIEKIHIDGKRESDGEVMTMLTCQGHSFLNMTYKGGAVNLEKPEVIGVELCDREGNVFLVRRDGTYYHEVKK